MTARLKDAVDLGTARNDLADVVHAALEPAHLAVWLADTNQFVDGKGRPSSH